MSYDLYFTGKEVTAAEFTAYFAGRPHYKSEAPQVVYQNEATGVYFIFEHSTEREEDSEAPPSNVALNINFLRPHIFALEAEPEITALVDAFSFTVFDPQNHGMGTGPYLREGFLQGWNAGNEFGIRSVLGKPEAAGSALTYPSAPMEDNWKWDLHLNAVQNRFGEDIFVPKISYLKKDGKAFPFIVWGDAIPTLIPKVDLVLIPRKDLAPRSLFGAKQDMCLIPFQQVADSFGKYATEEFGHSALLLPHPTSPPEVINFVKKLKSHDSKLEGVSVDKIIDLDSFNRAFGN